MFDGALAGSQVQANSLQTAHHARGTEIGTRRPFLSGMF